MKTSVKVSDVSRDKLNTYKNLMNLKNIDEAINKAVEQAVLNLSKEEQRAYNSVMAVKSQQRQK